MNTLHFTPPPSVSAVVTSAENGLSAPLETSHPVVSESLLSHKAILVHLGFSQIGRTRQLPAHALELARRVSSSEQGEQLQSIKTKKGRARVSKTLFECVELKRVEALDDQVRAYVRLKCLPAPTRAKGVYLIPLGMVETVDQRLNAFKAQREALVEEFVKVYPRLLVRERRVLGELFDRHDYPGRNGVAACFRLEWSFVALGVPDALGEISSDIFERERQKSMEKWQETQEQIQQLLRVRLKSMLERLSTSLEPKPDGTKKKFFKTSLDNINAFMADFNALNITGDAELEQIAGNVRDLLSGVEPETLRDSQNLRGVIMDGAKNIENQLTTLLVDKPKRLISFEDE